MKKFRSKTVRNVLFLGVSFFMVNCASYKPSVISGSYEGSIVTIQHADSVQILASYYSLKKLDTLEGSHETAFARDQRIAKEAVEEQLNTLCSSMENCVADYFVTNEITDISSDTYIDLKIHQYVSWGDVFLQILPIYYSVNESYCVTADIYKGEEMLKNITEWGFTKEHGFWIIEFREQPNSLQLRAHLIQKVLDQTIKEIN